MVNVTSFLLFLQQCKKQIDLMIIEYKIVMLPLEWFSSYHPRRWRAEETLRGDITKFPVKHGYDSV